MTLSVKAIVKTKSQKGVVKINLDNYLYSLKFVLNKAQ